MKKGYAVPLDAEKCEALDVFHTLSYSDQRRILCTYDTGISVVTHPVEGEMVSLEIQTMDGSIYVNYIHRYVHIFQYYVLLV